MKNISKLLNQESHSKAIPRHENTIKIRILIMKEVKMKYILNQEQTMILKVDNFNVFNICEFSDDTYAVEFDENRIIGTFSSLKEAKDEIFWIFRFLGSSDTIYEVTIKNNEK